MHVTYQLPETATLAWVPIVTCDEDMSVAVDGNGRLCLMACGRCHGDVLPPQPGDVIECPGSSFRIVRTVRACKACDMNQREMDCLGLGTKACLGAFGQQAVVKSSIGDAWQHWGWLVEVKAESKTRSDLRVLCAALGIPLKEEKANAT